MSISGERWLGEPHHWLIYVFRSQLIMLDILGMLEKLLFIFWSAFYLIVPLIRWCILSDVQRQEIFFSEFPPLCGFILQITLFDCIECFSYTYLLQGRDLSPVTNQLWKTFFELDFGAHSLNVVVERMKKEKVKFPWRKLYEVANFPFFPVTLHTGKRHSIVLFYI